MQKIIYFLAILLIYSCNNDELENSHPQREVHDCSVWAYLTSDRGTSDSTVVAIRHAGLEHLFDGTDASYPEITFFGFTNHSVRNFLFSRGDEQISDIPVEECRDMILPYIIAGKRLFQSFPYEIKGTMEGGDKVENLAGQMMRIYLVKHDFQDTQDAGIVKLAFESENGFIVTVTSCNIQTTNAVVHSLETIHVWGEI